MNTVANENRISGRKAQKAPSGTVIDASSGPKTAAPEGQTALRLEVSWNVAAAQNVAILDVSGKASDPALSSLASTGPAATATQPKAARAA